MLDIVRPATALNPMLVQMPPLVRRAYQDYLDMGPYRSVTALWVKYRALAEQNPNAMVPTTQQDELARWEVQYQWRDLAIEHDNALHEVWQSERKDTLVDLYSRKIKIGKKMQRKAYRALELLKPEMMRPGDISAFLEMGTKLETEATEKIVALENPKTKTGAAGDNYAELRQMIANTLQIGSVDNMNVQINVGT